MTLKLLVKSEECGESEELLLSESSYSIGRLHDNDLSIQRDCVSGYHAELKQTSDGGYAIIDLNSTNGTFLNESRVTTPEEVKPGDRLKLGDLLITVVEHIEVVLQPENDSFSGGGASKVISMKDEFGFASGENFNTYPITPIRIPRAMGDGNEVVERPFRMEDPVPESGIAAQQAELAKEAERAREAERAQQIERAREAERAQQIERAREAERAQQIERAKEAERAQQIERAKEAERAQQIERAREAERAQQIERAKEAERAQQIERAREAERAQQIERAREAERAQQIERAREAERAQQIERAKEAERAQQIEQAKEAERAQQIERAREAERAQQIERAREAERAQQIERAKEAERAHQIERAKEVERAQQIERAREAEGAEVDLRERPEPARSEDFRSKLQSLTAQLESAMREISRLKTFIANHSSGPAGMNGHAAVPAKPGQSVARGREEHVIQRSGNNEEKGIPAGQERELREDNREDVRVGTHTISPIQRHNSENAVAFRTIGEPPSHSIAHLRPPFEPARCAGESSTGNEARQREDNARTA